MAATPIGLCGEPPGMSSGSFGFSALMSGGGAQSGLTYLASITEVPDHCCPARPTPTGYRIAWPAPTTR